MGQVPGLTAVLFQNIGDFPYGESIIGVEMLNKSRPPLLIWEYRIWTDVNPDALRADAYESSAHVHRGPCSRAIMHRVRSSAGESANSSGSYSKSGFASAPILRTHKSASDRSRPCSSEQWDPYAP